MSESITLTDEQFELIEEYANAEPVTEELQARIDADLIVKKVIELMQSSYPTSYTSYTIKQQ